LVTNARWQCCSGEVGGWIGQAAYADNGPEVADMGSLGPTHLIALLLAVAIIGSMTGFIASAAMQKKKRHARLFLALGFFCGLLAGAILRSRRGGLTTFAPRALNVAASHLRPTMWGFAGDRRAVASTGFVRRMGRSLSPRR
jgi:uncharacterized membrane protein YeaQ/YmgE (transglycosylase-associated protein family)